MEGEKGSGVVWVEVEEVGALGADEVVRGGRTASVNSVNHGTMRTSAMDNNNSPR